MDKLNEIKYNFFEITNIDTDILINIKKNIKIFCDLICNFKNILFIIDENNYYDYNKFFSFFIEENHNIKYVNKNDINNELKNNDFKPDIIIINFPIEIDIKNIFNCKVFYLVENLYNDILNKYYYDIDSLEENNKYINKLILTQIKNSDYSFVNSSNTQEILKNYYSLNTYLFYYEFIPYINKQIINDYEFHNRKYNYGLIVDDFTKQINNIQESIDFLKGKNNVILIGKNSKLYEEYGFICIDQNLNNDIVNYYKDIKYIIKDNFYDSSNYIKFESLFYGCKINPIIVISSTQYPGYGGAATNAYELIKEFRKNNFKTVGIFFHDDLNVNYDPDNIGGIYLYNFKYYKEIIIKDVLSYTKKYPNICLAKNYMAPIYCKDVFNCWVTYLVSGINHFCSIYNKNLATEILSENFIINEKDKNLIQNEIICNTVSDKIILNSKLCYDLFFKIYGKRFSKKISKEIINTTLFNKKINKNINKYFDIALCCSNFERIDKNNKFLLNILKNPIFDCYKKVFIGSNYEIFKDIPNSTFLGLQTNKNSEMYLSQSKVLLFPSLFDANSNTVIQAYYNYCLPIVTNNIGNYEYFDELLICNSFNENEWTKKIILVLSEYNNLIKNIKEFKSDEIFDILF